MPSFEAVFDAVTSLLELLELFTALLDPHRSVWHFIGPPLSCLQCKLFEVN